MIGYLPSIRDFSRLNNTSILSLKIEKTSTWAGARSVFPMILLFFDKWFLSSNLHRFRFIRRGFAKLVCFLLGGFHDIQAVFDKNEGHDCQHDHIPHFQYSFVNRLIVHIGATSRIEIIKHEAAVLITNFGVPAGYVLILNDNIIIQAAPNRGTPPVY